MILTGCAEKEAKFNIEYANEIRITSGNTGNTIKITSDEDIKYITDNMNGLKFEKGGEVNSDGWNYSLNWVDENGSSAEIITIMNENTVIYDGYYYNGMEADAGIDIEFIESLFESPIKGYFADEEILNSDNYHEFISDDSEYTTKLVFKANEKLTDVVFSALNYDMNGTYYVEKELYTLPELNPDKPLVAGVVFYGDMTAYGISFKDDNGNEHNYAVLISGKDGSLVMNEY